MSDFLSTFFTPLDKSSCVYFLIISIFFFVLLVIVLFSQLYFIFTHFKNLNFRVASNSLLISFNIFIAYFVNRLLYSMCMKTLA